MLRISWQTLRTRRGTLAGAFVAIALAVSLAYATGLLMAGALSAPGPGRLAAADVVLRADPGVTLGHGDSAETEEIVPAPGLQATAVPRAAAVSGVARAVPDVTFPVGAWSADGRRLGSAATLRGHGWASAQLTPYRLTAGHEPAGPREVVADARLGLRVGHTVRIVTPAADGHYRVSGIADGRASRDESQAAVFFTDAVAGTQSGSPGHINAVGVIAEPGTSPGELAAQLARPGVDVLDHEHGADADPGDPSATDRAGLTAIFGTMGGIAGAVALFVVAGTFALAITQRRRETAVLRALGATPAQVRRLLSAEALIVSAAASVIGVLAGRPLAHAIAGVLGDHGIAPPGFELGHSWLPLAIALGGGIGIAQLAVVAAARRAGRTRPSEALREVAIEHARPGWLQIVTGVVCLGGGVAMSILFAGEAALAFSIIGGLLLATGTALLGRVLLGLPAAALSLPFRLFGAPGLLASTSVAANRWRTAALATPVVLIAMLIGTQGIAQVSSQEQVERVTAERVTAGQVVVGRDGAPLPAGTARDLERLPGVEAAVGLLRTDVFLLDRGLGWDAPWPAAGLAADESGEALDLHVTSGSLRDVRGTGVAVSQVAASEGRLQVGDAIRARMADTTPATLRVAAVYERAPGLGDVVLDGDVARSHASHRSDEAVFVVGGARAERSLSRYAATRPGVETLNRSEYLGTLEATSNESAWGVWLIVGLSVLFAALALVNTAAMSTSERRAELATIRLLGGTAGQATRMIALELVPVMLVALAAGAAITGLALLGVPEGARGIPLIVPVVLAGGLLAGTVALGLAAGAVTARLALRATPASAMRAQE